MPAPRWSTGKLDGIAQYSLKTRTADLETCTIKLETWKNLKCIELAYNKDPFVSSGTTGARSCNPVSGYLFVCLLFESRSHAGPAGPRSLWS